MSSKDPLYYVSHIVLTLMRYLRKLCSWILFTSLSIVYGDIIPIKHHQSVQTTTKRLIFQTAKFSLLFTSLQARNIAMAASIDRESILGKYYLITGSTDGIGKHTAERVAAAGGNLLLHGRNPEKLKQVSNDIQVKYPKIQIRSYCHDLSSTNGAKLLADELLHDREINHLDALVNNAGIFTSDYHLNDDGIESTFAVNVVAPFILSILLLPLLQRSKQSRILNVSSTSQEEGNPRIILDNLQFQRGGFSDHAAYSLSKLCMAAMSHELAMRVKPSESLVFSCDPGDVDTQMLRAGWAGYQGIPVEEADNEFELVTRPWDDQMNGKYFVSCRPARCNQDVYNNAKRVALWNELERISGVTLPHA